MISRLGAKLNIKRISCKHTRTLAHDNELIAVHREPNSLKIFCANENNCFSHIFVLFFFFSFIPSYLNEQDLTCFDWLMRFSCSHDLSFLFVGEPVAFALHEIRPSHIRPSSVDSCVHLSIVCRLFYDGIDNDVNTTLAVTIHYPDLRHTVIIAF